MDRRSRIGLDRRLDFEWLDVAAEQARQEASTDQMRAILWALLEGVISGDKSNSARGKTVTVLNHIWGSTSDRTATLRAHASEHLEGSTSEERLALHWAMMLGSYPVFTDIASAAGRLLSLQGSFTLAHLTRRLVATWGERSSVRRSTQRIVRSMIQWNVLRDAGNRGTYEAGKLRTIESKVGAVLVEALLLDAEEMSMPLEQLVGHPALFPFSLNLTSLDIRRTGLFQIDRQGLEYDFVALKDKASSPPSVKVGKSICKR